MSSCYCNGHPTLSYLHSLDAGAKKEVLAEGSLDAEKDKDQLVDPLAWDSQGKPWRLGILFKNGEYLISYKKEWTGKRFWRWQWRNLEKGTCKERDAVDASEEEGDRVEMGETFLG